MSSATIVFVDVVGFSKRRPEEQSLILDQMNGVAHRILGPLFKADPPAIIVMPTGDGFAVAFLQPSEDRWDRSTLFSFIYELQEWARSESTAEKPLSLRIGVHEGSITTTTDISGKQNLVGHSVNSAQRVMDAANPKQVLFSDVAFQKHVGQDDTTYTSPPFSKELRAEFSDPIEVVAKHGQKILVHKMATSPPQEWWSDEDPPSKITTEIESKPAPGSKLVGRLDLAKVIIMGLLVIVGAAELWHAYFKEDPVAKIEDASSQKVEVQSLTPLQRELRNWSSGFKEARFSAGEFLDSRGIMTSFGEYLRDIVVSECSSTGAEMADEPDIPVVSGKYVLLSDDVSITLRVTTALGTITNQKTFDIPADADYEAMMVSRVDNTLVNVVPVKSWGGGELSISKEVFREGDEVDITFIPKVDCYVTVFNIVEDGTVTVLLPNRFRRDGYARGGAKLVFPGHSEKDNGLVLRAHLPEGKVRTRESIKVVATKSPVDFTREDFTEAVVQSFRPDSQGITKLVANLQDLDDSGAPWFEEVRYFVIEGRDAL